MPKYVVTTQPQSSSALISPLIMCHETLPAACYDTLYKVHLQSIKNNFLLNLSLHWELTAESARNVFTVKVPTQRTIKALYR